MTNRLQPNISKVLQVSYNVSPLFTEEVATSKLITFNLCLCSAISKLCFVRVEFSKNRLATYKFDIESLLILITIPVILFLISIKVGGKK